MTIYNPSAVRSTAITMPDDGADRGVANVVPPISAALDNAEFIFGRCLPFVLNGNRNRPGSAIVSVPTGSTVKIHTTAQSLLNTYLTTTIGVLVNAVLDVRQSSGGVVSCDVILGTRSNGADLDQVIQRWDVPASSMPRTISISTWLALGAGSPVNAIEAYVSMANASSATIDVHNVSLSGLILKNAGA